MTKKRTSTRRSATRRPKRPKQGGELLIPIGVAVIVFAVIIGALFGLENEPADIPYPEVPRVSVSETWDKLQAGEIILVDVRGEILYDRQHIAGAISIPEEEIAERLSELPVDEQIVLYCT
jgi:hypothetical protein